jgi:pimeloyl-ACP methyl ester carboxylesterase
MLNMTSIQLPQGEIEYVDVGSGPVIVFVHGLLVDNQIWQDVIAKLSDRYRCIAPTLPLGCHRKPMNDDANLTMDGQAKLVSDFMQALKLDDVTLVGNDTGGAICQLVVADHPQGVARVVLTNCDAFEVFPPDGFKYLLWAPKIPGVPFMLFTSMLLVPILRRLPIAYGAITNRRLDSELLKSWVTPGATQRGVRRDLRKLVDGAGPHVTLGVADRLHRFDGRALLLWSRTDKFFATSLAERLQKKFKDASIEWVDGSSFVVPLDQPERVAHAIDEFCARRAASPRPTARRAA